MNTTDYYRIIKGGYEGYIGKISSMEHATSTHVQFKYEAGFTGWVELNGLEPVSDLINFTIKHYPVGTLVNCMDNHIACEIDCLDFREYHHGIYIKNSKNRGYIKVYDAELKEFANNSKPMKEESIQEQAKQRGFVKGAKFIDLHNKKMFVVKNELDSFYKKPKDHVYIEVEKRSDKTNKTARIFDIKTNEWAEVLADRYRLVNNNEYNGCEGELVDVSLDGDYFTLKLDGGKGNYGTNRKNVIPIIKSNLNTKRKSISELKKGDYVKLKENYPRPHTSNLEGLIREIETFNKVINFVVIKGTRYDCDRIEYILSESEVVEYKKSLKENKMGNTIEVGSKVSVISGDNHKYCKGKLFEVTSIAPTGEEFRIVNVSDNLEYYWCFGKNLRIENEIESEDKIQVGSKVIVIGGLYVDKCRGYTYQVRNIYDNDTALITHFMDDPTNVPSRHIELKHLHCESYSNAATLTSGQLRDVKLPSSPKTMVTPLRLKKPTKTKYKSITLIKIK